MAVRRNWSENSRGERLTAVAVPDSLPDWEAPEPEPDGVGEDSPPVVVAVGVPEPPAVEPEPPAAVKLF